MRFTVCIPASNIHARCFEELRDSIAWALGELGHDVAIGREILPGTRGILLGSHPHMQLPPPGTVLYNGEQVGSEGGWSAMVDIYRRYPIWDYSAANASRYKSFSLPPPAVVRPGYAPVLDGRIPPCEKTHDVAFFGSINARRRKILDDLQAAGATVLEVPFGLYGKERDALIARAKLCINIHFYPAAIFESVRCSYLAQNGMAVVSEQSADNENALWGIVGVEFDHLVAFVKGALAVYRDTGELQQQMARKVSLLDDVRAAVDALTEMSVSAAPGAPQLTLCMIVKNEAAVIERCLLSMKPRLTKWCIVDTGSTDGTQDIIRRVMADMPGQLHEREWKGYDGSRTEALNLARAECSDEGWLALIDADEVATFEGELQLPDGFDCYNGWFTRCEGCTPWARPMFLRANKPWEFVLPRHEALWCPAAHAPSARDPASGVLVLSTFDGARAKTSGYERFMEDARVLEEWLAKNPKHPMVPRALFYIGQSYQTAAGSVAPQDRGALQKAVSFYLRRADHGDYAQEAFSARYQAAQCMMILGYPWERAQQTYLMAYAMRASRAEPLYNIVRYYREQGDLARQQNREASGYYALAVLFGRAAATIGPSGDSFSDVDHTVNDWRIKDELATALTYVNGHAEARDLNRFILQYEGLAPYDRHRIRQNLEMCLGVAPDPGQK